MQTHVNEVKLAILNLNPQSNYVGPWEFEADLT
jgi:hypothetical protein